MDAKMIHITTGPTMADPTGYVNMAVDLENGQQVRFTTRIPFRFAGFRGLWFRFLVWGIRNYVKGIN